MAFVFVFNVYVALVQHYVFCCHYYLDMCFLFSHFAVSNLLNLFSEPCEDINPLGMTSSSQLYLTPSF